MMQFLVTYSGGLTLAGGKNCELFCCVALFLIMFGEELEKFWRSLTDRFSK